MGAPKKQTRKYETPKKPYDRVRLDRERKIRQDFGLRRKKEIWKAEALLRNFRQRARELQARRDEEKEKMLFGKVNKMGIKCSRLEDILEIGLEDILARRLQTLIHKKGIATTPMQARQFIVHGHVFVAGRKVLWPSYIVEPAEEDTIILEPRMATAIVKQESGKK
ncbi:MAG: 30S ribosomal protein S4 [Candidatus Aenigmarchaeota archaeon]|nr:30S ribosomal protein S4 [Candidatus Aenigmarchaeota archaeon]